MNCSEMCEMIKGYLTPITRHRNHHGILTGGTMGCSETPCFSDVYRGLEASLEDQKDIRRQQQLAQEMAQMQAHERLMLQQAQIPSKRYWPVTYQVENGSVNVSVGSDGTKRVGFKEDDSKYGERPIETLRRNLTNYLKDWRRP